MVAQRSLTPLEMGQNHRLPPHGEIMSKREISLSPAAVAVINRILSDGHDVKVHINGKTNELMIYKYENPRLEYKVVVPTRER